MEKKRKAPQLRFRGFEEEWEYCKLGDLGTTKSGIGFPDDEQGGCIGIPFFKVSDMNKAGNEVRMISSNNYVTKEQITRKNWKPITQLPAIIFAKVGAALLLNRKRLVNFPFLIDNNSMAYILDSSWDIYFGKVLFDTIDLPIHAQIGALPSFNGTDIERIEVCIPSNRKEQTKNGTFFQNLDALIDLRRRKLDKLTAVKKAMLEKMFPKEGADAPEIRFKGFTGKWEKRKLGKVTKVIGTGKSSFTTNSIKSDNTPYAVLGSTSIIGYDCTYDYSGDFILTARVGANAGDIYRYSGNVKISDNTVFIQSNNIYFLYFALLNFNLKNLSFGTGQPLIKASELSNLDLFFPYNQQEQIRISEFLNNLDSLIALRRRELDKLKQIKKACLEKMFA